MASDCIEWTGRISYNGYGQCYCSVAKKHKWAHRKTYEDAHGEIPKGMQILHSCDNRKCVNLDHLSVGSKSDNFQDMIKKGRSNYTGPKLVIDQVKAIKRMLSLGLTQVEVSKHFNVTSFTINHIATGRTWRHVQV